MKELGPLRARILQRLITPKEIKKYKHRDPVFVTSAEIKGILNYLGYRNYSCSYKPPARYVGSRKGERNDAVV